MKFEESEEENKFIENSYGYWEWHLKRYEFNYYNLTKQGKHFANTEFWGMLFCGLITSPIYFLVGFIIYFFEISEKYHGVVGAITIVIATLSTWFLFYLIYPTIVKFAFPDGNEINEEERQMLLNRRFPKSFVQNTFGTKSSN